MSDNYSEYEQEFVKLLEPFSTISDGDLGRVSAAKHPINVFPGETPVNAEP